LLEKSGFSIEKSLIHQLRDMRDNVSVEIHDMKPEQLKQYLATKQTLHPTAIWQNQT